MKKPTQEIIRRTRGRDTGTANADTLQGTAKAKHIYALAGNDSIADGTGNEAANDPMPLAA